MAMKLDRSTRRTDHRLLLNTVYFGRGAYGIEAAARPTSARAPTTGQGRGDHAGRRHQAAGAGRTDKGFDRPTAWRTPDAGQLRQADDGEAGFLTQAEADTLKFPPTSPSRPRRSPAPRSTAWTPDRLHRAPRDGRAVPPDRGEAARSEERWLQDHYQIDKPTRTPRSASRRHGQGSVMSTSRPTCRRRWSRSTETGDIKAYYGGHSGSGWTTPASTPIRLLDNGAGAVRTRRPARRSSSTRWPPR